MAATLPDGWADEIAAVVRRVVREEIRGAAPDVMTVEQAAAYAGRAPKTIRGWLLEGLPATRRGRRVQIKRAELDAWLARPLAATETEAIVASLRRAG